MFNDIGVIISLIGSFAGIIIAIFALVSSWQTAHFDRVNTNTWSTYEFHNSPDVREGRMLARAIMRDTSNQGFRNIEEYKKYFQLDGTQTKELPDQKLHDLAAFYHQTGILLSQNRLDRDFTFSMVGEGLHDRWPVIGKMPEFFSVKDENTNQFVAYGGIYYLYNSYLKWRGHRRVSLEHKFENYAGQINKRLKSKSHMI
jgi:hypothetical protein